jgi:hypothetical protein
MNKIYQKVRNRQAKCKIKSRFDTASFLKIIDKEGVKQQPPLKVGAEINNS